MIRITSYAGSDRGLVRDENEDSFLLRIPDDKNIILNKGILAIVADGVGGGPDGKLASSMAVELIKDQYYSCDRDDRSVALQMAMEHANCQIYLAARKARPYGGMATTCTAFALINGQGCLCHVGDSRAYLLHDGTLRRISKDHTLVGDMVDEGIISEDEARKHPQRNIILKALGSGPEITPQIETVPVNAGDTILLCSDGLHGCVSDAEIFKTLYNNQVAKAGKGLKDLALQRGGADNITLVILSI
jgi:protein phosphatase